MGGYAARARDNVREMFPIRRNLAPNTIPSKLQRQEFRADGYTMKYETNKMVDRITFCPILSTSLHIVMVWVKTIQAKVMSYH